jgi:hypothetical protein
MTTTGCPALQINVCEALPSCSSVSIRTVRADHDAPAAAFPSARISALLEAGDGALSR